MTARGKITSIVMVRNNQMLGDIYEQISPFYSRFNNSGSHMVPVTQRKAAGLKLRDLKKLGDAVMKTFLARFAQDESGATAIEYGLIAAFIGVGIIAGLTPIGTNLNSCSANINAKLAVSRRRRASSKGRLGAYRDRVARCANSCRAWSSCLTACLTLALNSAGDFRRRSGDQSGWLSVAFRVSLRHGLRGGDRTC